MTAILVIGSHGQVGHTLLQPLGTITALDRIDLDLTDTNAIRGKAQRYRSKNDNTSLVIDICIIDPTRK